MAVIDLGSNTCLLLIARRNDDRVEPLVREMEVVRLGEGTAATGRLNEAAMERALAALKKFRMLVLKHGCRQVKCVATAAFREAQNRGDLAQRIRQETGFMLEEISGQQEARYVLRAVRHSFPAPEGSRIIIDIGGGSTELIEERDGDLVSVASLPLGSVRLTERFLSGDPPAPEELSALQSYITGALENVPLPDRAGQIVGVGGTATTFVAMERQMDRYDHAAVHGAILTGHSLDEILAQCIKLPLAERKELPGLHPGRAEVIIAGGLIQSALLQLLGLNEMLVSDHGLRWGVALELCDD